MHLHQTIVSLVIAISLLLLVIRLIQKSRLDVAYCWLWLVIGIVMILVVLRYDWLLYLTHLIGAVAPTTTLFLLGLVVVLLMCLQFSIVTTTQRRQIKRLTQGLAIIESKISSFPRS